MKWLMCVVGLVVATGPTSFAKEKILQPNVACVDVVEFVEARCKKVPNDPDWKRCDKVLVHEKCKELDPDPRLKVTHARSSKKRKGGKAPPTLTHRLHDAGVREDVAGVVRNSSQIRQ